MRRDDLFFLAFLAIGQAWLIASHFAREWRAPFLSAIGVIWVLCAALVVIF